MKYPSDIEYPPVVFFSVGGLSWYNVSKFTVFSISEIMLFSVFLQKYCLVYRTRLKIKIDPVTRESYAKFTIHKENTETIVMQ